MDKTGLPQRVIDALNEHMEKYDKTEDDYVIFVRQSGYAIVLRAYYDKLSVRKKNKLLKGCQYAKL